MSTIMKEVSCPSCNAGLKVQFAGRRGVIECEYCGKSGIVSKEWTVQFARAIEEFSRFDQALNDAIIDLASMEEIRRITVQTGALAGVKLDPEMLPGRMKSELSRELVLYCRRREYTNSLVIACEIVIPNFDLQPYLEEQAEYAGWLERSRQRSY